MNEKPTFKEYRPENDEEVVTDTNLPLAANKEKKPKIHFTEPPKRGYLSFLRVIATLSAVIGICALIVFVVQLISIKVDGIYIIISLSLTLEGLLAYGLLNAVADITENMIDVGTYVRDLRNQNED